MKFKIGDRVKSEKYGTGIVYNVNPTTNRYFVQWDDMFQRNMWVDEETLKLVIQTDDATDNKVGNIPAGTKFVIEVKNAHEDVDGLVHYLVQDQGWWSISEARLNKLPKLDDSYTSRKEMNARCDKAYQDGIDAAWECARKIVDDPDEGGLNSREFGDIFGSISIKRIFKNYTASEAIEKIEEYEKKQKADKADEAILPDDWMDIEADLLTYEQMRAAVRVLRREIMKLKNNDSKEE